MFLVYEVPVGLDLETDDGGIDHGPVGRETYEESLFVLIVETEISSVSSYRNEYY